MITGADAQPRSGPRFYAERGGARAPVPPPADAGGKRSAGPEARGCHQPRASGFLLSTGVLDDACEVVDSEVESVVGQLQRSPSGLLAAEVAELAGYVVAERVPLECSIE